MAEDDQHSPSKIMKDAQTEFKFSNEPSLEQIRLIQDAFAKERGWGNFHTPRNVLLGLVGSVGGISRKLQWKEEGQNEFTEEEKQNIGHEMSDALVYLIRLAHSCNVDLPAAVLDKIELNRKTFPIE